MASSGTVNISTQSVDYPAPYTRGAVKLTNVVGWSVDDQGYITFSSISSSDNAGGSWGICGTTSGYGVTLEPQVSYDGTNWVSLDTKFYEAAICSQLTNTIAISKTLIGQLGRYKLNGDCSLRFLYYANRNPAPSASLPNSFPNSSYSAAVQVPVHVDVSWKATLKYNANGGTGAPAEQSKTVSSGDSTKFSISSTVPTKSSYRFEGWRNGSTTYHHGDQITVYKSSPTVTVTAVWEEYYRPGERKISGVSKSLNRSGGVCERKGYGEMKTIKGGIESNDPPSIKTNGTWYNMKKTGGD